MKTKLLIGLGALSLLVVAGAAWAMGPGGHRGHMMKHMISARVEDMEDYLEATPQQRQVIEQAKDNIVSAVEARAQGHHDMHQKLMDALTADKVDEAQLYSFADARAKDIQDLAKVIVPNLVKVHDTLTPAQRQKLAAKLAQHRQHMQDHGGGFGGPPGE